MQKQEVVAADVTSGSALDMLLALEKRAIVATPVANSASAHIQSLITDMATLLTRITQEVAHNDDITTLLSRVVARTASHTRYANPPDPYLRRSCPQC